MNWMPSGVELNGREPTRPDAMLPAPSRALVRWTSRKSMERSRRHETNCVRIEEVLVRIRTTRPRIRNDGSRVKKAAPNTSPAAEVPNNPQCPPGNPIQAASRTLSKS